MGGVRELESAGEKSWVDNKVRKGSEALQKKKRESWAERELSPLERDRRGGSVG